MTEPSREEPVPAAVGRYELLRELGRGTMGIVYEARDPALGRAIALKVIQTGGAQDSEREAFEQRFLAEARIAARLSHPGIVVVHDVGRDPGSGVLYIALEYLHGRTLAQVMATEKPLDWREALRLGSQIGRALHHAHAQGIVHRDMKPANVMVLESGEPKIMDFGIAKAETARVKLTAPGEFLGTPLYMAPEQALGEAVDARADIFSLGAIVYTLLAGRPAFAAASIPQIVARVVKEDPAPPSSLVPAIPPAVDRILARAMAKEPGQRHPDALSLAEDLDDARAGRPPRHRASAPGEEALELVLVEDPLETALSALVAPAPAVVGEPPKPAAATPSPAASPREAGSPAAIAANPFPLQWSEAPPPARLPRRRVRRAILAVGALLAAFAATYLALRSTPDEPASRPAAPRPVPAGPPVSTLASGSATPTPEAPPTPEPAPGPRPGRLAIDFEHPLKAGLLRVWVDGELVVEEKLKSTVTKEALVFTVRRGSFNDVLEVPPGKHEVRFQVTWEDNEKTERIVGSFRPGATRRLEARVGRLRKNLSLEWK